MNAAGTLDLWEAYVAKSRAEGHTEEGITVEADKRRTNPTLYDCAVAVWELDRPDVLRACIDSGSIEPDAPTIRTGQTLLYLAIVKGRIRSVRTLLAAGADPRRQHAGHDYLWWAAYVDAPPGVVEAMLDASERVGIAPSEEALSVARSRARPETVALFERWRSGDHTLHLTDATDTEPAGGVLEPAPDAPLAPGDRVRVRTGQYASFEGTVTSLVEGTSKLVVAVSIFGRSMDVTLERAELGPMP